MAAPLPPNKPTTPGTPFVKSAAPSRPIYNRGRRSMEPEHNLNGRIRAIEVRLVGDNVENGVFSLSAAQQMADEQELDLVEISSNATPPVCRVVDYKKFLYERKMKAKEVKANTVKQEVKEIRFGPNTDEHDFEFKLKHAEKFLSEGNKVRAFVLFRGRAIVYKERGEVLLLQFAQRLSELGKVEMMPKLEGKKMILQLSPKGKGSK